MRQTVVSGNAVVVTREETKRRASGTSFPSVQLKPGSPANCRIAKNSSEVRTSFAIRLRRHIKPPVIAPASDRNTAGARTNKAARATSPCLPNQKSNIDVAATADHGADTMGFAIPRVIAIAKPGAANGRGTCRESISSATTACRASRAADHPRGASRHARPCRQTAP